MDNKILSYIFGGSFLIAIGFFSFILFFIKHKNIEFGIVNLVVLGVFFILGIVGLVLFYVYLSRANTENIA